MIKIWVLDYSKGDFGFTAYAKTVDDETHIYSFFDEDGNTLAVTITEPEEIFLICASPVLRDLVIWSFADTIIVPLSTYYRNKRYIGVDIMFCPNCGNQLPEDSKFCPNCGKPVSDNRAPTQPQNTYSVLQSNPRFQSQSSFPTLTRLITGYVVICCTEVIAALVCISAENENDLLHKIFISFLVEIIGVGLGVYFSLTAAKAVKTFSEEQKNKFTATANKWKLPMVLVPWIYVLALLFTAMRIM